MSRSNAPDIRDVLAHTDLDSWMQCASTLICGVRRPQPSRFRNANDRIHAIRLAHAALVFAGESILADEVAERIRDAT